MRKHRSIDIKSLMGRRKGYGVGRSRRQRVGKKGIVRLDDSRAEQHGQEFRDEPEADVELQTRANLPRSGNAFRDEIARQEAGRF